MTLLGEESKKALREQLKRHEGVVYKAYLCSQGKPTIGVGRNLEDLGISDDEAMFLMDNDIDRAEQELSTKIPYLAELSEVRIGVLINMDFNLGITRLLKFVKMLEALEQHDYDTAAEEMLGSLWASQVGNRAIELSEMMKKG
jgi:lysozyme